MNRKLALFAALLVLFGSAMWFGTRGGAAAGPVLHVGSQKGGTKAVMMASGALEGAPYKVQWSEFPAAQHLLEAIGSEAVDLGLVGDAPFQFAYQAGSPIVAVGAQRTDRRANEALAILVPERSPVKSMADLRGKRIATTRGSIGHYLTIRALEKVGLDTDAVQLTFLAPGDAKAAFSSGAIDAWATWVPYVTAALKENARIVADGKDYESAYGFQVANRQAAASKHGLIEDFLRREAAALRWAQAHLDEYGRTLAAETGLPQDVARTAAEKNGRASVPIDDAVIGTQQAVLDGFARAGALTPRRPIEAGFDKSFSKSLTPQG